MFHPANRGQITVGLMYCEKLGGLITARCAGVEAGRQEADCYRKNDNMDVDIFYTLQHTAMAVGCSSPFEPLMKGLRL